MKKTTLAVFLLSAVFTIRAQTMFVRPTAGVQTSFVIADIQKLTFSNGDLLVTNTSGANNSFSLFDLRYLNFADLTLGIENQLLSSHSVLTILAASRVVLIPSFYLVLFWRDLG